MQYNMEDPRARLMQKWSSNLPAYDSTYLRESEESNYDNGKSGIGSGFLGSGEEGATGKKKRNKNKKGKGKGGGKGSSENPLDGLTKLVDALKNMSNHTPSKSNAKKQKGKMKYGSGWDEGECHKKMSEIDAKVNKWMHEFQKALSELSAYADANVMHELQAGLNAIALISVTNTEEMYIRSLQGVIAVVKKIKDINNSLRARNPPPPKAKQSDITVVRTSPNNPIRDMTPNVQNIHATFKTLKKSYYLTKMIRMLLREFKVHFYLKQNEIANKWLQKYLNRLTRVWKPYNAAERQLEHLHAKSAHKAASASHSAPQAEWHPPMKYPH